MRSRNPHLLSLVTAIAGCGSERADGKRPDADDTGAPGDSDTGTPTESDTGSDTGPDTDTDIEIDGDGDGWTASGGDCDDANADVHPGAVEICGDGAVNDCDGNTAGTMESCGIAGTTSLSTAHAKWLGERADVFAGSAVSSAGDVDGDGFADILVGAGGECSGGSLSGAAYLLLGGGY